MRLASLRVREPSSNRVNRNLKVAMEELVRCVRRPSRIRRLWDPNARKMLRLRLAGVGDSFVEERTANGVFRRHYPTYEAYVLHQRSKLEMMQSGSGFGLDGTDLGLYDVSFRADLRDRLQAIGIAGRGDGVLCLAARIGTEVKAFLDCGCFAVGVDLNPGPGSSHVLQGDFHSLVFADASIDVVYCNSIDHAFDLQALFLEVHRVLKPGGTFVAEVQLGSRETDRNNTGGWESLSWESVDLVLERLAAAGFRLDRSVDFARPWPGRCLVLKKMASASTPPAA